MWGWLISWFFIQCVAMGMAELCSSMPTSGGLYYAAAVLAPPGYGPFAAWITGWSNWIVQVTGAPSVDYALSAMILASASITHPSYIPTDWQVFLLTVFVMIIHACRVLAVDDLLRIVCGAGSSAKFRKYALLWHGICGHWRHGVGLVDQLVLHPMRSHGNG